MYVHIMYTHALHTHTHYTRPKSSFYYYQLFHQHKRIPPILAYLHVYRPGHEGTRVQWNNPRSRSNSSSGTADPKRSRRSTHSSSRARGRAKRKREKQNSRGRWLVIQRYITGRFGNSRSSVNRAPGRLDLYTSYPCVNLTPLFVYLGT